MTSIRILLVSSAAIALSSCSWFHGGSQGNYDTPPSTGGYDTSNPYGVPGSTASTPAPSGNATYSPAAYEDSSATAVTPSAPSAPTPPSAPVHSTTAAATTPKPSASTATKPALSGTVHTVVKGDTLWGIGKKYNVSVDSIKKANGLTKDTVVLGAKLQIPAK